MLKIALWMVGFATLAVSSPANAEPGGRDPCAVAHAYIDLVHRGDYAGIGNLFAEGAEYLSYARPESFHGPKEIAEIYRNILSGMDNGGQLGRPADVRVRSYVGQGPYCVIELEAKGKTAPPDDYTLVSVDHITIDESGKISRFVVYVRPGLKLPGVGPAPGK